jgi:hypothetical protein
MVGLVETMLKLHKTAYSLRLTAYGPDENEIHVVEGAADGLRLWDMGDEREHEVNR